MALGSAIDVFPFSAPEGTQGLNRSDHVSFWKRGYPALMITDTSYYRNPHYHTLADTPDTLNYMKMAEVVKGVFTVLTNY
jgi:Zn-dependent M28 family amino/carboxypeptidase